MIFADHGAGAGLIDDAVGLPLFIDGVLDVSELEDHAGTLAGLKGDADFKDCAGGPAAGHCIFTGAVLDHFGKGRASVAADEGIPVRIEAVDPAVHGENGVRVAAFPVFRAVIDRGVIEFAVIIDRSFPGLLKAGDPVAEIRFDLDFAGGKVPLEVLLVVIGIPEAPFNIRKDLEALGLV